VRTPAFKPGKNSGYDGAAIKKNEAPVFLLKNLRKGLRNDDDLYSLITYVKSTGFQESLNRLSLSDLL
jgi:hypothetical protein